MMQGSWCCIAASVVLALTGTIWSWSAQQGESCSVWFGCWITNVSHTHMAAATNCCREFLAAESRKCAQKSLFGGRCDTLAECFEDDPVGFQRQCAICWADDILCTKDFCAMIGIQSFFINTLTNFAAGEETITAAACEEAHCEAGNPGHFVSCSGAARRRMNVTSSISRPGSQQCSISDVNWAELFPNPHPYAEINALK